MAAGEPAYTTLGEVCDPTRGITYGIVKVGTYVPGGVPVIRGGDIRGGRIVFDDEKRVTAEVSQQFARTILRGGEILINLISEPGHTAIVPAQLAGANVSRDVGVIALDGTVDHRYVDYCLKSPTTTDWLRSRLQGSVTQKINLGTLRELPIRTPPISEQHAIASVLGALDDKIELNRRMSETLEAIARALFRSWFVDFDPVSAKADGSGSRPGLSPSSPVRVERRSIRELSRTRRSSCSASQHSTLGADRSAASVPRSRATSYGSRTGASSSRSSTRASRASGGRRCAPASRRSVPPSTSYSSRPRECRSSTSTR
jgi:hypothetical protein